MNNVLLINKAEDRLFLTQRDSFKTFQNDFKETALRLERSFEKQQEKQQEAIKELGSTIEADKKELLSKIEANKKELSSKMDSNAAEMTTIKFVLFVTLAVSVIFQPKWSDAFSLLASLLKFTWGFLQVWYACLDD